MILFYLVIFGLFPLPTALSLVEDPAPGLFTTIEESRRYDCRRVSKASLVRLATGAIEETAPRGEFIEEDAVVCEAPVIADGERHPRDAAILDQLSVTADDVARRLAVHDNGRARRWLVEVHYPNPSTMTKVAFATKSALMREGLAVSDRLPSLARGDVEVLSGMPPLEAYPLACRRYFAPGRLRKKDAVLSLLVLDSRETALHAGSCVEGEWTWLR